MPGSRGGKARQSGKTAAGRPRCEEQTKRGTRCGAFALPGKRRCWLHDPDRQGEVREARSKGAVTRNKLVALEGRRRRLETPAELVRFLAGLAQDCIAGELTPDVVRATAYTVSIMRHVMEASDIARRVEQLEATEQQARREVVTPWR
jgi:hypothetical protein